MKLNRIFLLVALPIYLLSCKTQQKLPYYLEHVSDSTGKGAVVVTELRIQKNDLLSIQIYSISTKPEVSDAIYNQPSSTEKGVEATGYLVDINGNIHHHRLGTFHAEGKTKEELALEIKKRLTEPVELLKEPSVVVRFLNFRVTVLGEVERQGMVSVPVDRLTILEAVGLAGGIKDYGKKSNVKVLREYNGERETGIIDLTSNELFSSKFYNLVQNDVIIIDATNQKIKEAEDAKTFRKMSLALTFVTVTATLVSLFTRN